MSQVLIRRVPRFAYAQLQRISRLQDLSRNQLLVRLMIATIKNNLQNKDDRERHSENFRKLLELRREIYEAHGRFDDSTALIREDRDSR